MLNYRSLFKHYIWLTHHCVVVRLDHKYYCWLIPHTLTIVPDLNSLADWKYWFTGSEESVSYKVFNEVTGFLSKSFSGQSALFTILISFHHVKNAVLHITRKSQSINSSVPKSWKNWRYTLALDWYKALTVETPSKVSIRGGEGSSG